LLLILFTLASRAEDNSYAKQIADFRQEHESSTRKDTGPLLLVSRVELPEGETVVQLQPGRRFGSMRRTGTAATFTPERGVGITQADTAAKAIKEEGFTKWWLRATTAPGKSNGPRR
jgi:hypothetical protein